MAVGTSYRATTLLSFYSLHFQYFPVLLHSQNERIWAQRQGEKEI